MSSYEALGREPSYLRYQEPGIYALTSRVRRGYSQEGPSYRTDEPYSGDLQQFPGGRRRRKMSAAGRARMQSRREAGYVPSQSWRERIASYRMRKAPVEVYSGDLQQFLGGRRRRKMSAAGKARAKAIAAAAASGAASGAVSGAPVAGVGAAVGGAIGGAAAAVGATIKIYGTYWGSKVKKFFKKKRQERKARREKRKGTGSITPITKPEEQVLVNAEGQQVTGAVGIPSVSVPPAGSIVSPESVLPPVVGPAEASEGEAPLTAGLGGKSPVVLLAVAAMGLYIVSEMMRKKKPGPASTASGSTSLMGGVK